MFNKKVIQILDLPSPGIFGGVFGELILSLTTALQKQGFDVIYSRDLILKNIPAIVFGWYRMFIGNKDPRPLPPNAFVFNLSPLVAAESSWFKKYISSLEGRPFIDYSYRNIEFIKSRGLGMANAHIFKFGYAKFYEFSYPRRNKNYLFYGKLNDYRLGRIEDIKNAGIDLKVLTNVWGVERDIQIATARAIVNIGKYQTNILEVYRIWHSLCLGTPVISERGVDQQLVSDWERYVAFKDHFRYSGKTEDVLISPEIFQRETCFQENVISLLKFINNSMQTS